MSNETELAKNLLAVFIADKPVEPIGELAILTELTQDQARSLILSHVVHLQDFVKSNKGAGSLTFRIKFKKVLCINLFDQIIPAKDLILELLKLDQDTVDSSPTLEVNRAKFTCCNSCGEKFHGPYYARLCLVCKNSYFELQVIIKALDTRKNTELYNGLGYKTNTFAFEKE